MRVRKPKFLDRLRPRRRRRKGAGKFFAWLPKKLDNGEIAWLERVARRELPSRRPR